MITGIMASTSKGIIGINGKIPWYFPEDLLFFEEITKHKNIIMGRKTFESLPKKLYKNRNFIVFSRNYKTKYAIVMRSIYEFLDQKLNDDFFMIGGGEIANLFFKHNLMQNFILTKIKKEYDGDSFLNLNYLKNWEENILFQTSDYIRYLYTNPKLKR